MDAAVHFTVTKCWPLLCSRCLHDPWMQLCTLLWQNAGRCFVVVVVVAVVVERSWLHRVVGCDRPCGEGNSSPFEAMCLLNQCTQGGQLTPIDLIVEERFHRAAPGGMGGTKAAGNYSPELVPETHSGHHHHRHSWAAYNHRKIHHHNWLWAALYHNAFRRQLCCSWTPWPRGGVCLFQPSFPVPPNPLVCPFQTILVLVTQLEAKKAGYSDVVYLDAKTDQWLGSITSLWSNNMCFLFGQHEFLYACGMFLWTRSPGSMCRIKTGRCTLHDFQFRVLGMNWRHAQPPSGAPQKGVLLTMHFNKATDDGLDT
eukprot:1159948-Pelagomonas_calceolata.AAC.9